MKPSSFALCPSLLWEGCAVLASHKVPFTELFTALSPATAPQNNSGFLWDSSLLEGSFWGPCSGKWIGPAWGTQDNSRVGPMPLSPCRERQPRNQASNREILWNSEKLKASNPHKAPLSVEGIPSAQDLAPNNSRILGLSSWQQCV